MLLAACGGRQVPEHSGYKNVKSKPWQKAKLLSWDEKGETKASGDLSYAKYDRSAWYMVDVPAPGELALKLEVEPPGDEVNEDFDLALEVLDPGNRVISKADLEEDDAGEINKSRLLYDLQPGRYMIHVYLQGRLDVADFDLRLAYKRAGAQEVKSDFTTKVAFVPPLPMVPVNDDTPKGLPKQTTIITTKKTPRPPKETPKEAPPATTKTARILGVSVVGGGTQIMIGLGKDQGVDAGWKAKVAGVQGSFSVASCNARTCSAVISATPDQIKSGGNSVTLSP